MILIAFQVITTHGSVIVGVLALVLLSQFVVIWTLKRIFNDQLTLIEYSFLGLAGWILPASLISIFWIFSGFQSTGRFELLFIVVSSAGVLFFPRLKTNPEPDSKPIVLFLLLFISISLLMRLEFIGTALLPSYFDSAQHYLLIKKILRGGPEELLILQVNYYHIGYHILAAFVTSTLQAKIAPTMLVLGQIILAVMPISIFFPIRHITKSKWAAIFAVLTSAWGWYMPAHAIDWGKYPALTSIGLIPFVLSLTYLFVKYRTTLSAQKQWGLGAILAVSTFVMVVIHSRALVIFGIAILAWVISAWGQKLSMQKQAVLFFMVMAAIVLESIFIQQQEILSLLFDPYIHKGILITFLVLFLSVFAQKSYPQLTLACNLSIFFLLGSIFIPIPNWIPGYNNLDLLDRPFVEILLYLPLSLLGGLGLAGLEEFIAYRQIKFLLQNHYLSMAAIGLVIMNTLATYASYPSSCCIIAGNDDVVAIAWMGNQLPMEARIGIASTELKVMASNSFEGIVGSDAGIWISPLIERKITPLSVNSDFRQQAALTMLCQIGISHLYIGGLGQNFNTTQLNNRPAWYRILLSMPRVKVYQVIGCNMNQKEKSAVQTQDSPHRLTKFMELPGAGQPRYSRAGWGKNSAVISQG